MKLLVLGGTRFLGLHVVEAALARGHEVTLFNRGLSLSEPPAGVEHVRGDRDGGLAPLRGRRWDAVVDTSGYVPRLVRASAELLTDAVEHYTFVSSLSVIADSSTRGLTEDAPLHTLDDPNAEEVTGETYGGLKALCEGAAQDVLPGRVFVIRPGLIVGPYDETDRFPYWLRRVARGGEVLAPGSEDAPVQFADVRDHAAWILNMAESRRTGVYNATGPAEPLSFGRFLDTCRRALGSNARFTWVDETFLLEKGVTPFNEMPLWVPSAARGFTMFDCSRARDAGLTFRPLEETIRDTYAWDAPRSDADRNRRMRTLIGSPLSASRERELLAAWRVV